MELLRWFVQGLGLLIQLYFQFWMELGAAVNGVLGSAMPEALMNLISVIIGGLLLTGGLVRAFFWNRKGNRPQSITLYTKDTPYDVVAADMRGLLRLVLTALLVGIVLSFLISRILPPP